MTSTDPLHAIAPPSRVALSDRRRYGREAIAFHWITFVLLIVVGTLGLLHDSWPDHPTQSYWINVHAVLGLLLGFLTLGRLYWRLTHAPPALPSGVGELSRRLSRPVHRALYVLLLVTPMLGIVTFIWHGRVLDLGLLRIDFHVRSNRAIFHPTEDIHGYLAYALFALAGLHAAAALWHQLVARDGLLDRMWPGKSS